LSSNNVSSQASRRAFRKGLKESIRKVIYLYHKSEKLLVNKPKVYAKITYY